MNTTLAHDYILISLDDNTGDPLQWDSFIIRAGIAAAFVAEMVFSGRLIEAPEGQFALAEGSLSAGVLGRVEQSLARREPAPLSVCIQRLWGPWKSKDLVGWVRDDLVAHEVLKKEADKFLFVTLRTRLPAADMTLELSIRERLRKHVSTATSADPVCRDDALLSLLEVSNLLHHVWPDDDLAPVQAAIHDRASLSTFGAEAKQEAEVLRGLAALATTPWTP
ncbi:MAG: hypothetical protein GWP91_08280 [Rhodobacterales bacterium]|nr:hypothetical protein [Rhodobacterales bacterium]